MEVDGQEPGDRGDPPRWSMAGRFGGALQVEHAFPAVDGPEVSGKPHPDGGIAFDIGMQDQTVTPTSVLAMDSALTRAGIPHSFEQNQGGPTDKIRDGLASRVLPFFTRALVFH